MQFLNRGLALFKRHYEKFLLGFVLLGLLVAVGWLLFKIEEEQTALKKATEQRIKRKGKEVKPIDLSRHELDLQLAQDPPKLNLSRPHNLFNPVKWQMKPDGTLVKVATGKEIGPEALIVTNITSLRYILSFERPAATGYFVGEINEAHPNPRSRGKTQAFVSTNTPSPGKPFILREVQGPADDPTELIFEMTDTKERVSVTKETPYTRVSGYKVDLRYDPANKTFNDLRVGSKFTLEGEEYNIASISSTSVVVSAKSNDKRTTISYNRAP
ncbi:MAG: hypothetical protein DME26_12230 [Verrucomicrobia bacterium]|nr:MAG: hypothetical protein DME26_12230 [Verrucomicrobiota bacterium]